MNTRNSYDFAKPPTLVLIISDALDAVHPTAGPISNTRLSAREIVTDAYNALTANVGIEDANDMLFEAGIGAEDLDRIWSAS